jgi:hypothetical protein
MLLADMPGQRQICPVTLFLALAVADNAIDGVHCTDGFATLLRRPWSGWISLRYRDGVDRLSVLRRTGNKSKAISSCLMKPSVLQKMMQAQISRAGHEDTFVNIVQDVRKSSCREKRREYYTLFDYSKNP